MDGAYPTTASRTAVFSESLLEPSREDGHSLTYSLKEARPRRQRPPKKETVDDAEDGEEDAEAIATERMREAFMEAVMNNDEVRDWKKTREEKLRSGEEALMLSLTLAMPLGKEIGSLGAKMKKAFRGKKEEKKEEEGVISA